MTLSPRNFALSPAPCYLFPYDRLSHASSPIRSGIFPLSLFSFLLLPVPILSPFPYPFADPPPVSAFPLLVNRVPVFASSFLILLSLIPCPHYSVPFSPSSFSVRVYVLDPIHSSLYPV